jgi:hypothetical protein
MEERELLTSRVPRALELKNKLFGVELADVLIVVFSLSVSNLIFGGTRLRVPLVWGGNLILALVLHFSKKGKPDGYLQHLGEYLTTSENRFAGLPDLKYKKFFRKENNGKI